MTLVASTQPTGGFVGDVAVAYRSHARKERLKQRKSPGAIDVGRLLSDNGTRWLAEAAALPRTGMIVHLRTSGLPVLLPCTSLLHFAQRPLKAYCLSQPPRMPLGFSCRGPDPQAEDVGGLTR
jgi:hypothetical protein